MEPLEPLIMFSISKTKYMSNSFVAITQVSYSSTNALSKHSDRLVRLVMKMKLPRHLVEVTIVKAL